MRRPGLYPESVTVRDISRHGCRLCFSSPLRLDELVFVRFEGLETMPAMVCWVRDWEAGVEWQKSLHPAVFDHLVKRLGGRCPPAG